MSPVDQASHEELAVEAGNRHDDEHRAETGAAEEGGRLVRGVCRSRRGAAMVPPETTD